MIELIVTLVILGIFIITVIRIGYLILIAPYKAIRQGLDELEILGGKVKLILWEPNEGIVVLRNKKVKFTDNSGMGGKKYIFPIAGEELRARVPLAIRFLMWEDEEVLTRESLQAHIRVAIWWRVDDIVKYTFDIDRSIHANDQHTSVGVVEAYETWLKAVAESTLRVLVSRASIAQLISTAATRYLEVASHLNERQVMELDSVSTIAETIATRLHEELKNKVILYGIGINQVEIQEVRLPAEVQQSINKVWMAFLKPIQSEQEARARQIELEAAARVLGTDAVALNEILKNFQGSSFYMVPPFIQSMFGMIDGKVQGTISQSAPLSQQNKKKLTNGSGDEKHSRKRKN